jgi:tetratricopeptide (TPR) repeat protein
MRWLLSEYVLKGIFLGLLIYVARLAAERGDWQITGTAALATLIGLVVCLAIAALIKFRQGYRARGRRAAFTLFLLLESPSLVYAGIVLGLAAGALYATGQPAAENALLPYVGAGAALGLVFAFLPQIKDRRIRIGVCFALAALIVGGALYWFHEHPDFFDEGGGKARIFGGTLLVGLPVFYLLTFAGLAEETEVEIGAICGVLGLGMWFLLRGNKPYEATSLSLPVILYLVYTVRVLPGLRVFKHTVRGIGFANVGRYRPALLAFRRALQLDPENTLARESFWSMHRAMDINQVAQDRDTLALVDFGLCMDRVRSLLLEAGPTAPMLAEANHFLDLVERHRPDMMPVVHYWRAVALLHARRYEEAAAELGRVLDGSAWAPGDPQRESVLLQAWQLALLLHPEMNRRVGTPQFAVPGRRMEGIAAVERRLAVTADDSIAWDLKRLLYSGLTEADYRAAAPEGQAVPDFDYSYVHQLGLALINDRARWQRGAEYLRLAVIGLPLQVPSIHQQLSLAYQNAGDAEAVWRCYEQAVRLGRAVGPKKLPDEERQLYFAMLKLLAEDARGRDDLDSAVAYYQHYADYERSGLETLRTLADLYERKGDLLHALRTTDAALVYNASDPDLLERKDRYYYSITPEQLQAAPEAFRQGFDVGYCLRKARALMDHKEADLDVIEWAEHLAALAQIMRPESVATKVLRARALRRRGEMEQTQALLEDAYQNRPEKFATAEDEDAWYLGARLLGEMYLYDVGKPELAITCFRDYRKSSKSGADTLYKLAQAYEQVGDRPKAVKCYEHVIAYGNHPLTPDAKEALYRLQSS